MNPKTAKRLGLRGPLALFLFFALNAPFQTAPARAAAPEGQMTWAVAISLAPTWFDPAETAGILTPFMILYAIHDAIVKPMPGNLMAPSLAESWSVSSDGLLYEFLLRKGVRFHNGEVVTAEDVKFSLERYRGAASKTLKERIAAVEAQDPRRVRIRLKQPWPDFMAFYSSATGAGWVVPKRYVELVGDEGFKRTPVGAGPYKFVSFTPGVELVMEAFDQYWRKPPSVKRLIFKVVPDGSTRLAALKRGEVDIAYGFRGELADEIRRTPGLTLEATLVPVTVWVSFADQWDPKSPWYDRRVRVAANHAIHRQAISQAEYLGFSKTTWSIIPSSFDLYWQPPSYPYDPAKASTSVRPRSLPSAKPWSTTYRLSASGRGSARSSGRPSSRDTPTRGSRTSSRASAAPLATPPPGSRPSSPRVAPTSMGATPTSTGSSGSRRSNSTGGSATRSFSGSSSSCTRKRSSRRFRKSPP